MGLAIQVIRPRNRGYMAGGRSDVMSLTENGQFMPIGPNTVLSGTEPARAISFPYAVVIERFWFRFVTNTLTGGSTNTFTPRVQGVDTVPVISMDNTDDFVDSGPINIALPANQRFTVRWNSDSAGTTNLRNAGCQWRAVVLG